MSDIYNLNDTAKTIVNIGELVNKKREADVLNEEINTSFKNLKQHNKTVLYLIWNKPYMAAGQATFIGSMLQGMGLKNVLSKPAERYPQLSINDIKKLNPQVIFLSTEPFPFKQKHISELQKLLPNCIIMLVDGEPFSWYGSRLLQSASYFNQLNLF
jgi:ABC-type Fe3+-hydroxamate transport system substrate-binding protein